MKKFALALCFVFVLTMVVRADSDLQQYMEKLAKLHKALLVQNGFAQYFEGGYFTVKPTPIKRVCHQVMSFAFKFPYVSVCFKYMDKEGQEQTFFRCTKITKKGDSLIMDVLIKVISGAQTKTLAFTHTITKNAERSANEIKIDQERSDRGWMCWADCAIYCGSGIWNAYQTCGSDINCWINQFPTVWECYKAHCDSCF